MAQGQHTPGPWTVSRSKMETDGAFDYAISADGVLVLAEAFGRDAKGGWPPSEANARLIAAAPDMEDGYRRILESVGMRPGHVAYLSRADIEAIARAAIARAEGRAQ